MSQESLSPQQTKVLSLIEEEISRSGRPPTYRDIAQACGDVAVGTIQDHVRALIRKGYLEKEPGVARGLRLAHHSPSVHVPILGTVPAGSPLEALENNLGFLSIPAKWPLKVKAELFALRVKGDSMIEAGILEGDYVIVKKQNSAENGEIVVAMIDGEATVKTFSNKNGKTRLLPANPRYSPIEIQEGSENWISGRVVSVQRYY
jgi:repressor LexA